MAHNESLVALNGTQISYIGHDCKNIPDFLGDTYGQIARRLDLSFNHLRMLKPSLALDSWATFSAQLDNGEIAFAPWAMYSFFIFSLCLDLWPLGPPKLRTCLYSDVLKHQTVEEEEEKEEAEEEAEEEEEEEGWDKGKDEGKWEEGKESS
ncbi:hypothetical protein FQN60_014936 [Etheostoma spectabile]|uniref:Uncharacterized protein n=1 Tax=Etheostoma spectabile TaxID=54343 RepID=A0A5J5CNR1_9PERO|nr:hypothetical protein FQN60_014936 [Etheostoma spectabile]